MEWNAMCTFFVDSAGVVSRIYFNIQVGFMLVAVRLDCRSPY